MKVAWGAMVAPGTVAEQSERRLARRAREEVRMNDLNIMAGDSRREARGGREGGGGVYTVNDLLMIMIFLPYGGGSWSWANPQHDGDRRYCRVKDLAGHR